MTSIKPPILDLDNKPLDACNSTELAEIQRAMEWLTYNPGPIDGLYGNRTRTAWNEFKLDAHLGNPDWVGPDSSDAANGRIEIITDCFAIPAVKEAIFNLAPIMRMPFDSQIAYIYATVQWETAGTWEPVKEAYWVDDAEAWRQRNLKYYPYYGRGYVQLTWESNYAKYQTILGAPMVEQPDLACEPDVALFVLVHGFATGAFTGRKMADYVSTAQPADFYNCRRCINGTDKATEIKSIANQYYGELHG